MISETMPLNEWPVEKLYFLRHAIINMPKNYQATKDEMISVISMAIKDAQERENELPFK